MADEPILGNPYQDIPAEREDFIDFPVSPGWAAHYASIGMTAHLPEGFPMYSPATPQAVDYDPAKVDIGEHSPLWAGLENLFPAYAKKAERQKRLRHCGLRLRKRNRRR